VVAQLLDVFGFLSVLCRGVTLALAALTSGGTAFLLITLRGVYRAFPEGSGDITARLQRWTARAAAALVLAQAGWLGANSTVLVATTGIGFGDVWGANFFMSGLLMIAAAIVISLGMRVSRPGSWLLFPAAAVIAAEVMTSHSAARVESQLALIAFTALHHAATAIWIGGLPYWLLALRSSDSIPMQFWMSRRFSRSAQLGVAVLFAAGVGLTFFYVPSAAAFVGTSYGLMVAAKIILFALVVMLGGLNFLALRKGGPPENVLVRLRHFGEAEIGIGFTVILAAASLTSQPPGADMGKDLVRLPAIVERMAPRLPRMQTPPLSTLSPSTRETWKRQQQDGQQRQPYIPGAETYVPPTEGDIAWSEYNHHWAGLIVLVAGVLALLARTRMSPLARHWPLAFIGLAVFLLIRADPENWPLGPNGFWESFSSADVLQHRLFVILILGFSLFEWGVQTGRMRSGTAALVFPLVCSAGGALLLTHTHALANIQEELLAEMSHLPLGILGVLAGWSRWLELRLPGGERRISGRIWPVCLVLVGSVLLFYREA